MGAGSSRVSARGKQLLSEADAKKAGLFHPYTDEELVRSYDSFHSRFYNGDEVEHLDSSALKSLRDKGIDIASSYTNSLRDKAAGILGFDKNDENFIDAWETITRIDSSLLIDGAAYMSIDRRLFQESYGDTVNRVKADIPSKVGKNFVDAILSRASYADERDMGKISQIAAARYDTDRYFGDYKSMVPAFNSQLRVLDVLTSQKSVQGKLSGLSLSVTSPAAQGRVMSKKLSDAGGWFDPASDTLWLNRDVMGAKNRKYYSDRKMDRESTTALSFTASAVHEFGHFLDKKFGISRSIHFRAKETPSAEKGNLTKFREGVSNYGSVRTQEGVAESFVLYALGIEPKRGKDFHNEFKAVMEKKGLTDFYGVLAGSRNRQATNTSSGRKTTVSSKLETKTSTQKTSKLVVPKVKTSPKKSTSSATTPTKSRAKTPTTTKTKVSASSTKPSVAKKPNAKLGKLSPLAERYKDKSRAEIMADKSLSVADKKQLIKELSPLWY